MMSIKHAESHAWPAPRRRRRGVDRAFVLSFWLSICFNAAGFYALSHVYFPNAMPHIFLLAGSDGDALEMGMESNFESPAASGQPPEIEERRVSPERRELELESRVDLAGWLENEASRLDMPKPAAVDRPAANPPPGPRERKTIELSRELPAPEAKDPEPPQPFVAFVPDSRRPSGEIRGEMESYGRPAWMESFQKPERASPDHVPELFFPVATERPAVERPPDFHARRETAAMRAEPLPALRDLPLPELAEAPDGWNEQGTRGVSEMRYRESPPPLFVAGQPSSPVSRARPEPLPALAPPASPESMRNNPIDKRPIRTTAMAAPLDSGPSIRDMPDGNAPSSASIAASRQKPKAAGEMRFGSRAGGEFGGGEFGGLSRHSETRTVGSLEISAMAASERVASDADIQTGPLIPPRNRRGPPRQQPLPRDPAGSQQTPATEPELDGEQKKMAVKQRARRLGTNPTPRPGGEKGLVVIRATIDSQGRCVSAHVRVSSGYPDLDKAALDAMRTANFQPATENGVAVATEDDFEFPFQSDHGSGGG